MAKSRSNGMRTPAEFPIDQIMIGDRHRKDLGDISALAESIKNLGLFHPIGMTPEGKLLFGRRRLEAYKNLGLTTIPVRIINVDNTQQLLVERDENTERKDFTPTEAVAIGGEIERRLRPIAAQRMKAGTGGDGKAGGRGRKRKEKPGAKLAPGLEGAGKTTEKAARAVGMSRGTYEKAKAVIAAAEANPQRYGDLPDQMDKTQNVDRAYRELKLREEAKPKKRPPAYNNLSEEVKNLLGESEHSFNRAEMAELASLDPRVQGTIARMLSSQQALSVGAGKVQILEELFLRPAEALRRAFPGLVQGNLPELRRLYEELGVIIVNGSTARATDTASPAPALLAEVTQLDISPAAPEKVAATAAQSYTACGQADREVVILKGRTPGGADIVNPASLLVGVAHVDVSPAAPEEAAPTVTKTYTVCGQSDTEAHTCAWDLESRQVAAAWLRENYATPACHGMTEFWIMPDDKDEAAVRVSIQDGQLTFATEAGERLSL